MDHTFKNSATAELNAAGFSMLLKWPAFGMRTNLLPVIRFAIDSDIAGGVIASSSPTRISVGAAMDSNAASGRSRKAVSPPMTPGPVLTGRDLPGELHDLRLLLLCPLAQDLRQHHFVDLRRAELFRQLDEPIPVVPARGIIGSRRVSARMSLSKRAACLRAKAKAI